MECTHAASHLDEDWLPLPRFEFCDGCPAFRMTSDGTNWSGWLKAEVKAC